jgi:hypothetical protein
MRRHPGITLVEASRRGRTIVTYNARDFVPLHRAFLAGGQMRALAGFLEEHAGVADFRDRLVSRG